MRKYLLYLLLLPLTLNAQQLFQKEIAYKAALNITDIRLLPDNGYIACGYTESVITDTTFAVVLRMDSVLNVLWCKSYNMLRKDNFRTVTRLSDGNFIVGGTTKADFSTFYGASMYKIDRYGNVIWHKIIENTADDATIGVFEQSDKSLVCIIRYGVTGQPAIIIHTDSVGVILNQIRISKPENHSPVPDYVVSNGNGEFFLCGHIKNTTTNNFCIFLLKAGITGVNWYKEYAFDGYNAYARGLDFHNNVELVISGTVNSDEINSSSILLMKIDPTNGNPLWSEQLQHEPARTHYPFGIESVSHSHILLTGRYSSNLDFRSFGLLIDDNGSIVWSKSYVDGPFAMLEFPLEISENRYLLAGKRLTDAGPYFIVSDSAGNSSCQTYPLDFITRDLEVTTYTSNLQTDDPELNTLSPAFVSSDIDVNVNTICSGAVATELPQSNGELILYPNPAKGSFIVETGLSNPVNAYIEILNLQGEKVFSKHVNTDKTMVNPAIPVGLYFIRIRDRHKQLSKPYILMIR